MVKTVVVGLGVIAACVLWMGFSYACTPGGCGGPCSATAEGSDEKAPDYTALYRKVCSDCHGKDGKPAFLWKTANAPDFTDPKWQEESGTQRLIKAVTDGKGKMDPFKGKLSDAEIKGLIENIVRGFAKKQEPEKARGKKPPTK